MDARFEISSTNDSVFHGRPDFSFEKPILGSSTPATGTGRVAVTEIYKTSSCFLPSIFFNYSQ